LFEQALSIYEASLGSNHPIVAANLFNLAYMLQGQEKIDAAQAMNQRALSITEAVMGPNHPSVAIGLNNLADLMCQIGEHAKAKALLRRAHTIHEATRGKALPHTATVKANIRHIDRVKACNVCGIRDVKLQLCSKCTL
jgi:tetratricopeptide (TPR) repeat protein